MNCQKFSLQMFPLQNVGLGVALGILCYSLQLTGHPSVKDLADKLHSSWLDGTTDQVSFAVMGVLV